MSKQAVTRNAMLHLTHNARRQVHEALATAVRAAADGTPDGEWEAWAFGNSKPGADRYRSFAEMIAGVIDVLEDTG